MDFLGVEIKTVENSLFGTEPVPASAIRLSETQYALKKRDNRDKGQRQFCGCILSKDIGEYNTCPHLCDYCYANASKNRAVENYMRHGMNPNGEMIRGNDCDNRAKQLWDTVMFGDQQANPKAYYGSHNSPTPSFAEWRSSSISPNVRFGEDLRL